MIADTDAAVLAAVAAVLPGLRGLVVAAALEVADGDGHDAKRHSRDGWHHDDELDRPRRVIRTAVA